MPSTCNHEPLITNHMTLNIRNFMMATSCSFVLERFEIILVLER